MKQSPLTVKQMNLLLKLAVTDTLSHEDETDARVLMSRDLIMRSGPKKFTLTDNGSRQIDLMKAVTSVV